jgi:hypothetical protein
MIVALRRDEVPPGDEAAEDAWYYQQALSTIRSDSPSFFRAVLLRLRRFWALTTADEFVPRPLRWITAAWYAVIWTGLALSLIGCRRPLPQKQSGELSGRLASAARVKLWLVVASFVVMHAMYWTDTRMRAPVMPLLLLLSADGWVAWTTRMTRHQTGLNP